MSLCCCVFFFFKQKTAYEMRISDWSSDVCSSDLALSGAMIAALRAGIESAERKAAGILVLAGAGRAFCAGADLKERRALDDAGKLAHNRSIAATADALAEAPLPTLEIGRAHV